MWGDKFWLRSNVATLTVVNDGATKDPKQAEQNHVINLWKRVLCKGGELLDQFRKVWHLRKEREHDEDAAKRTQVEGK